MEPLAEQHRGIAALTCATCPLGQATVDAIHAWPGHDLPPMSPRTLAAQGLCPYIWHVEVARRAAGVAATSAKLLGDPDGVTHWRAALRRRIARAVVADDCCAVT